MRDQHVRPRRMVGLLSLGGLLLGAPAAGPAWAAAATPLVYYSVTPCRVLDTRQPGQGPALPSGTARLLTVTAAAYASPTNAHPIQPNIWTGHPPGAGNQIIQPQDVPTPTTSAPNST